MIGRFEDIATNLSLPHIKQKWEEAAAKLSPNSSTISAAGFFHITKEYIAGVSISQFSNIYFQYKSMSIFVCSRSLECSSHMRY